VAPDIDPSGVARRSALRPCLGQVWLRSRLGFETNLVVSGINHGANLGDDDLAADWDLVTAEKPLNPIAPLS
jgi:hypothetical protein